jgi:hypothetical protein
MVHRGIFVGKASAQRQRTADLLFLKDWPGCLRAVRETCLGAVCL